MSCPLRVLFSIFQIAGILAGKGTFHEEVTVLNFNLDFSISYGIIDKKATDGEQTEQRPGIVVDGIS